MEAAMEAQNDAVLRLLSEHVPITLLIDLLAPPRTREVYVAEGGRADWLAPAKAA
jgi:hypothetical protein